MKAYVVTTGTIFGLVFAAHIWRLAAAETALLKDPVYILLTLAAAALAFWAWRTYKLIRVCNSRAVE